LYNLSDGKASPRQFPVLPQGRQASSLLDVVPQRLCHVRPSCICDTFVCAAVFIPQTSSISQPSDPLLHHNLKALCLVFAFSSSIFNYILSRAGGLVLGWLTKVLGASSELVLSKVHSCPQGKAHPGNGGTADRPFLPHSLSSPIYHNKEQLLISYPGFIHCSMLQDFDACAAGPDPG
jgi:hypothetical protein